MKKLTFCRIFLLIIFILLAKEGIKAQTVFIDESFLSGSLPLGWSEEKETSSTASWSYTDGIATFNGGARVNSSAAFITNAVDLSNSIMPTLSFSYLNNHVSGVVDSLVVFYRTDDNQNWLSIFTSVETQATMTNVSIELEEEQCVAGFQLKFEVWNHEGGATSIDNVKVTNAIACNTPPTEFRCVSISETAVSFMWNPGVYADSSRIIVATSAIDFENYEASTVLYDEMTRNAPVLNIVRVSSLISDTKYYAYLQVSCGSGDVSPFVPLQFSTPCPPVVLATTDIYTQDFEADPTCWMINSSALNAPSTVTSQADSGTKSYYFKNEDDTYSYVIIPIETTWSDMQLTMSVFANDERSDDKETELQIGVVDDPGNLSAIMPIQSIIPSEINEWQDVIVTFVDYSGTGKYLVLYTGHPEKENEIWIDDLVISEKLDCYAPQYPYKENITAYTADISWTELNGGSSCDMYLATSEILPSQLNTLTDDQLVEATTNPYTITNLTPNTAYYVYLRSSCGLWNYDAVEFTTLPTINIGYNDMFEYSAIGGSDFYWGNLVDEEETGDWVEYPYNTKSSSSSISTYTNNDDSEGGSLYLSSSSYYNYCPFVILPELEKSISLTDIQLSFWARSSDVDEPLLVSMCEGTDISTVVVIDTIYFKKSSTWEKNIIILDDYAGAGRSITFSTKLNEINSASIYIDDVNVEVFNPCNPISDLQATATTGTEATLSWEQPGALAGTTWTIDLYSSPIEGNPSAVPVLSFTANNKSMRLTGLSVGTRYYAYIRINSTSCLDAEYSEPLIFNTESILNIPYFNDFSTEVEDEMPLGWRYYAIAPSSYADEEDYYLKVVKDTWAPSTGSLPADQSAPSLEMYSDNYSGGDVVAVLPMIDESVDMSKLTIQFYGYLSDSYYSVADVKVGIMEDPMDTSTFVVLDSIYATSKEVISYYIETEGYTGSGRYIAFMGYPYYYYSYYGDDGDDLQFIIDNLSIKETTACKPVSNIVGIANSLSEVQINWDEAAAETSWNVKLMTIPATPIQVDTLSAQYILYTNNTTTKPLTISNLDLVSNTDYYVAVQSVADGCTGPWVVQSFNTLCDFDTYELPYFEDFSGYGTGNGTSPDCWYLKPNASSYYSRIGTSDSDTVLQMEGKTSGYSYAILPPVDSLKYTTFEFDIKSYTSGGYVEIGVMNSVDQTFKHQDEYYDDVPANDALFTPITTYWVNEKETWEDVLIDFSSYSGVGNRIAFRIGKHTHYTSYVGIYIDNVNLKRSSSCSKILLSSVDGVTPSSATLSWGTLEETEWDMKVLSSEMHPDSATTSDVVFNSNITTMPYTITGLADNTRYYAFVRRIGDGCSGEWSDVIVFTTTCAPISVGYIDDFEGNVERGEKAQARCWQIMGDAAVLPYPILHSMTTTGQVPSETDSVCYTFENSTKTTDGVADIKTAYAILPEMDVTDITTVQISFRAYTASSNTSRFEIGVVTDPSSMDNLNVTYSAVYNDQIPSGVWTDYRIKFANYTGDDFGDFGKYIVFNALPAIDNNGELTSNEFFIDDLQISNITTGCEVPFRFKADSVGDSAAKFSWVANTVSNYQLIIVDEPIVDITNAIIDTLVTSNPATISGLPMNSKLYAFVRSQCADGSYTDWSSAAKFYTTGCEADKLPLIEGFEYDLDDVQMLTNCYSFYSVISGADDPTLSTTNVSSGDNSLKLPHGVLGVLPMTDVRDLIMTMDMKNSNTSYYARVGVLRAIGDSLSFIQLDSLKVKETSTVESFKVRFCDYDTIQLGDQIAILSDAASTYSDYEIYIDNIFVNREDALWPATDVAVSDITSSSAKVSWVLSPTNVDSVEVAFIAAGQSIGNALTYTVDSAPFDTFNVTTLAPSTTYSVQVRVSLNGELSAWSVAKQFTTLQVPTSLPYSTDWEDTTLNDGWSIFAKGTEDTYWMIGTDTKYEGNNSLYITEDGSSYSYISGITTSWAYRTVEITEAGEYAVSVMAKCPTSETYDYLTIAFAPASYDDFDGQYLRESSSSNSISMKTTSLGDYLVAGQLNKTANEWINYSRVFTIDEPGFYNIVIHNYVDGSAHSGEGAGAVDNISVAQLLISAPEDVVVDSISTSSAFVSWSIIDESVDSIEVSLASETDTISYYVTSAPFDSLSLSDLTPSTEYTVKVRAYIDGNNSLWSEFITFNTRQIAASLPYSNDWEDATINAGWTIFADGTEDTNWMIGTDTKYEGSNSLYITEDGSTYSYANGVTYSWAYRTVEITEAGEYAVSAMAKCPTDDSYDYLTIAFVPASYDDFDGQYLRESSSSNSISMNTTSLGDYLVAGKLHQTDNEWTKYSRVFTIDAPGFYNIVISNYVSGYTCSGDGAGAVDNISVEKVLVTSPKDVEVDSISSSSALVSWSIIDESVDSVEVYFTSETDTVSYYITSAPFDSLSLSDLTPTTKYSVKVRAYIGENYSLWSDLSTFNTLQVAASLPYSADWEDATINADWAIFADGTEDTYWMIGTDTKYEGSNSLYITKDGSSYSYISGTTTSWAYRTVEITEAGEYTVSVMAKCPTSEATDYLTIAFVPASYDDFDGQYLRESSSSNSISMNTTSLGDYLVAGKLHQTDNDWTEYSRTFTINAPGFYNIVIHNYVDYSIHSGDGSGAVDNVSVKKEVDTPTNFAVSNITTNSASLSWNTVDGIDSCVVTLIDVDDNDTTLYTGITSNSLQLTGLSGKAYYKVSVEAYIGDNFSRQASTFFTTLASPNATYPYINNFDNTTETDLWVVDRDDVNNWWTIGTSTFYNDSMSLYITNDEDTDVYGYGYGVTHSWVYRDFTITTPGVYNVSLMAKCPSAETADYLSVSFIPTSFVIDTESDTYKDAADVEYNMSTTSIEDNPYLIVNAISETEDSWTKYSRNINITEAGTYRLAALYYTNSHTYTNATPAAIDSVSISELSCPEAENFNVDNITDVSATITWSGLPTIQYSLYVSTENVDDVANLTSNVLNTTVTGPSVDITGLTESTPYYIYVKANCDDASEYVKYNFSTVNTPLAVPYFNAMSYDANAMPDYWFKLLGNAYVSHDVVDPAINPTDSTLRIDENSMVVLPLFVADINTLELSFDAVAASDGAEITIGMVSNPSDKSTFVALETFDVSKYSSYSNAVSDYIKYQFDSYTGSAKFIALRSNAVIYVDDILVDILGTCAMPTDLTVIPSSINLEVDLNWSNSDADQSRVVIATTNAYDISTLEASAILIDTICTNGEQTLTLPVELKSTFYAYVSSICGTEATHSVKTSFKTLVGAVTLPLYEPITSESNMLADGFELLTGSDIYSTSAVPGDTVLELYSSPYLQFPLIASKYDLSNVLVSFNAKAYSSYYSPSDIVIGMLETRDDESSFVGIDTVTVIDSWTSVVIPLSNYTGTSRTLCIHVLSGGDIHIDDIRIYEASACNPPRSLNVSDVTFNSALFSFDGLEGQTGWRVVVADTISTSSELDAMTATDAIFMQDVTSTSNIAITGLDTFTEYYIYVKTIAGDCNDVAEWASISFKTLFGSIDLPFYEPVTSKDDLIENGSVLLNGSFTINTSNVSGDSIANIYSNAYLEFPEISDVHDISAVALDFKAMSFSASKDYMVVVGVLEISGDTSSFVGVDTVYVPAKTDPFVMQDFTTVLASYTGDSHHICLHVPTGSDAYFDDFYLYELSSCSPPTGLTVTNLQGIDAKLSFIPMPDQTDWRVVVTNHSASVDELDVMTSASAIFMQDVTTTSNIAITGLSDTTQYYAYVRGIGNCDNTLMWSKGVEFTTGIAAKTLPYFEDFSSVNDGKLPGGWLRSSTDFEDGTIDFMESSYYQFDDFAAKTFTGVDNSPLLFSSMNSDGEDFVYQWAVGPEIIISESTTFAFDLSITPTPNYVAPIGLAPVRSSEIRVYMTTDNGATWSEEIVIGDDLSDDYKINDYFEATGRIQLDIASYVGETIRFAYYIDNEDEVNLNVNIDNIAINCVGERTYNDFINEGLDYTANGFNISYTDLVAGTTTTFDTYVPSPEAGICDSLLTVNLTVREKVTVNLTAQICAEGDVYDANGFTVSYEGTYKNTDVAVSGADSITYLTITYREPNPITPVTGFICEGSDYEFAGIIRTEAGIYYDTLADVNGCDSIIELTLQLVQGGDTKYEIDTICAGDYKELGDTLYGETGVYTRELLTDGGCEYTVELTLTVLDVDTTYVDETINLDQLPYTHRDMTYDDNTVVGEYTHEFSIDNGTDCPDIEIYTLKVIEGEVAVDDTRILDLSMYPNPLTSGATLYVDAEFTASELDGMVIEVMNTVGQLIVRENPATDEITINGLTESGVYIVRITTGTGIQYLGKVIVK